MVNKENIPTYLAISYTMPSIGQLFKCNIVQIKYNVLFLNKVTTTKVLNIIPKEQNLFLVETQLAKYILLMPCKPPSKVFFAKSNCIPTVSTQCSLSELFFSAQNNRFIIGEALRTNVYIENVIKISENIHYVETPFFSYYVMSSLPTKKETSF